MFWVEVLSRHGDVGARQRCDGHEIRVGRAYDNDVVLDDPHVAPHHARIVQDDSGRLVAEDLGSVNGLRVGHGGKRETRVVLDGEGILRIGRTHVRVRAADHPVPPERPAPRPVPSWSIVVGLGGAVLLFAFTSQWLRETGETRVSYYLGWILLVVILALGWAMAWALLSRVFSGHMMFEHHLAIALAGLLVLWGAGEVSDYGAFALSWRFLADYSYVAGWIVVAVVCYVHLRAIGRRRLPLKAGAVIALGVVAIAMQTVMKLESSERFGERSYLPSLKPPQFRLVSPKSEAVFFSDTQKIRAAVDKARTEPPRGASLFWDLDSDSD